MEQILQFLDSYYKDGARKLHNVINKIFNKYYGGIRGKDIDEFYGIGTDVLIGIWEKSKLGKSTYDPSKGDFDGYVYNALVMAIIDELKKQNRDKRTTKVFLFDEKGNKVLDEKTGKPIKVSIPDVRLDEPVKEGENTTKGDLIQSDFNINTKIFENNYKEDIEEFLDGLSKMQRNICKLIMKGYASNDIREILDITEKQYKDCWSIITSYDNKKILYKNSNMEDEKMNTMINKENVTEKYKNTSYSIDSISKQLKKRLIRDNHILQRHSGQWRGFAKSELISDILRGKSLTQIIISEELKNGMKMQWLIDGKQRCTTLDDFLHDGFSVSKNVKNYNITYQAPKVDSNNNVILNEDGFTDMEWKTFDIRGKKFSQLPEELQDIFKDRQIPVLYNMDCTKKDIADDIARFNRSRPMNKAQNGWLGLEESFAEFVENIAKMDFFQPEFIGSTYTKNNKISGTIRRIIVESIMVSDFIEDFGDFDKMCEFLSEEASDSNFTEFYSLVERLTLICNTKEIASLFDTKDSFLWFGLFSRFVKYGLNDEKFADFMNEFENLREIKIDEESFDDILAKSKSTKDKRIVVKKMNHLQKLMNKYFNVKESCINICNKCTDEFIADNLEMNIESVQADMDLYEESLDELLDNSVKIDSKLRDIENRPSLLVMMAYSYKEDIDLDEWIKAYSEKNNTYFADQKKNFIHMKNDLEKYISEIEKKSA